MGVPAAIIFGLGLQYIQGFFTKISYPILSAILAMTLLYQYYIYFFQATLEHGKIIGEATYWTGPQEPKFAAYEFLSKQKLFPKHILTDEYWIEWPTRYYFMKKPTVEIEVIKNDVPVENLVQKINDGDALIVFANRDTDKKLHKYEDAKKLLRTTFLSYDKKETIAVWTLK